MSIEYSDKQELIYSYQLEEAFLAEKDTRLGNSNHRLILPELLECL